MAPENKEMIKDISIIIFIYGAVAAVFEIIFAKRVIYSLLGLLIGCILAVYMFVYMERILSKGMKSADSKQMGNYITKHSCIRYFSIVIVFAVICITKVADPIACFIGLLGLKIAAYLQPVISKLRNKPIHKGE